MVAKACADTLYFRTQRARGGTRANMPTFGSRRIHQRSHKSCRSDGLLARQTRKVVVRKKRKQETLQAATLVQGSAMTKVSGLLKNQSSLSTVYFE